MSQDEAAKIVEITKEYLDPPKVKEFFVRLDKEIGQVSENESLKISLAMFKNIVDPPLEPVGWWYKPLFWLLVVVHYILVCAVTCSFFLLPFLAEWYVALPLMVFVVFFTTNRVECKLTLLENRMRERLGMPQIGGFVSHYFKKPARHFWRKYITRGV